ncbi:hypothetical protein KDL45_07805 [bacterium]|nr:hypothetical protein [bacterium]
MTSRTPTTAPKPTARRSALWITLALAASLAMLLSWSACATRQVGLVSTAPAPKATPRPEIPGAAVYVMEQQVTYRLGGGAREYRASAMVRLVYEATTMPDGPAGRKGTWMLIENRLETDLPTHELQVNHGGANVGPVVTRPSPYDLLRDRPLTFTQATPTGEVVIQGVPSPPVAEGDNEQTVYDEARRLATTLVRWHLGLGHRVADRVWESTDLPGDALVPGVGEGIALRKTREGRTVYVAGGIPMVDIARHDWLILPTLFDDAPTWRVSDLELSAELDKSESGAEHAFVRMTITPQWDGDAGAIAKLPAAEAEVQIAVHTAAGLAEALDQ